MMMMMMIMIATKGSNCDFWSLVLGRLYVKNIIHYFTYSISSSKGQWLNTRPFLPV